MVKTIWKQKLQNFSNFFLAKSEEGELPVFQGAQTKNNPRRENILRLIFFLYEIHFLDEDLIGGIARRGVQKNDKSVTF